MFKEVIKDGILISDQEEVRYKDCGNVKELIFMEKRNRLNCLLKVDKDHYIDTRTGELKEYQHNENRAGNIASVKRSLSDLRDYMNKNIIDVSFCRWVTLTYAENMTDTVRLYRDYEKFVKRFKYRYPGFDYIVAMEPQGRGAWHCHVVFIWKQKAPFIPNNELSEIWGHGFVTVKRLDDVDNVGAYLTAYLGDMELDEAIATGAVKPNEKLDIKEVDFQDDKGQKLSKKYVKGARLVMYPSGFNLYRCSRGIKKPEAVYMSYKNAKKKVSAATLTFKSTVQITDPECGYQNIIQHEYYNTNIKKDNKQ